MCLKRKLKIVKCLSLTTARPGVRLDERTAALIMMKCLPLSQLIQALYPDMYKVPTAHTAPRHLALLLTVVANLTLTCRRWTHSSWRPPRRTRRETLCLSPGDCSSGDCSLQ